MDTREHFVEMESYVKGKLDEYFAEGNFHPWSICDRLAKDWTKEYLGENAIIPFRTKWVYGGSYDSYQILYSAKHSSPKLFSIHLLTKRTKMPADSEHPYEWNLVEIEDVDVLLEGNTVSNMSSLIGYCQDRVERIKRSLDKKESAFRTKINALGIETKDFMDLMNIYLGLDNETKDYIYHK